MLAFAHKSINPLNYFLLPRTHRSFALNAAHRIQYRFFEMDPSAAEVFRFAPSDLNDDFYKSRALVQHARNFINMIDRALGLLGPDVELLSEVLQQLGIQHKKLGVKPSHFPELGDALMKTLHEMLGDVKFNEYAKDGWCEVFQAMSYDMIRARDEEPLYNIHPGRRHSGDAWILIAEN